MSILGFSTSELEKLGGIYTGQEIQQQPRVWLQTWNSLKDRKTEISTFLNKVLSLPDLNVILTGAGTSAFIGNVLSGELTAFLKKRVHAIPTTDIVTHPEHFFIREQPTLIVSFARSGDSPESIACVDLADRFCDQVYHLIITCNEEGELAKRGSCTNYCIFVLPEETNDKSLAMTSSFTSMVLSGMLLPALNQLEQMQPVIERLMQYGETIIERFEVFKKIAELNFQRTLFLGSGAQRGTACESHLKLQELTDGRVICKHDSYLGLRHGPKSVIDSSTLTFFLLSNNPLVFPYETDLINSVSGQRGIYRIAIGETYSPDLIDLDYFLELSSDNELLPEGFLSICNTLPAQILGFFKSIELGLKPDHPSDSGAIHRVVKGVKIYPYV